MCGRMSRLGQNFESTDLYRHPLTMRTILGPVFICFLVFFIRIPGCLRNGSGVTEIVRSEGSCLIWNRAPRIGPSFQLNSWEKIQVTLLSFCWHFSDVVFLDQENICVRWPVTPPIFRVILSAYGCSVSLVSQSSHLKEKSVRQCWKHKELLISDITGENETVRFGENIELLVFHLRTITTFLSFGTFVSHIYTIYCAGSIPVHKPKLKKRYEYRSVRFLNISKWSCRFGREIKTFSNISFLMWRVFCILRQKKDGPIPSETDRKKLIPTYIGYN